MATPVYNTRRWGHAQHRFHHRPRPTSGNASSGWLDRVRSWLVGAAPLYQGQGTSTNAASGDALAYKPAPSPTGAVADAVPTAMPAKPAIVAVPRA